MEFIPVHEISKTFGPPAHGGYFFFMPLVVMIPHLHFVEKVRSRSLKPGKIVQK